MGVVHTGFATVLRPLDVPWLSMPASVTMLSVGRWVSTIRRPVGTDRWPLLHQRRSRRRATVPSVLAGQAYL